MSSAFESVVRSVVRELDPRRELILVDSLQNSTSFRPYYLLRRKPSSSRFWKPRYSCVNLSIKDILEPDAPEPDLEHGSTFHFNDTIDGKVQGNMEVAVPGQWKISGGAAVSGSSSTSMNVRTLSVDPNTWDRMQQERRLRQPEHKILQQLRSRRDDVFVVTKVLQTQEKVEVTRMRKQEGAGHCVLPGAMCLKGDGEGHLRRENKVTIPAGSILAFQVAQLVIRSDWDIFPFPDEKRRTFLPSPTDSQPQNTFSLSSVLRAIRDSLKLLTDGISEESVVTEEFQVLRTEVEAGFAALKKMARDLRQQLLLNLRKVLCDPPALQDLEVLLAQGLCGAKQVKPLQGPAGNILECLVLPSRVLVPTLAAPVFYLLGALTALSETQQQLLAQLLDKGDLSTLLELVEHLLEQSIPWQEQSDVSLPPKLLASNWGEEAPAWALLEKCGLELQVGAPQIHWEPQAQGPTCALYASLALLSGLS
ncbi:gasdermin-D isoform X2 [Fukomys damarensis]|uniref:Gasdermin-D n=2 Tax=Fukomys damarensis TaxID=885580 RepID=A0A091D6Y2_FUKDA|nr:gasdermin-D isoform X2 [Fukomys damarensis]XP_010637561.1 gasdermin-D isoform X2 [Fukomys damarensis]XP_010637562.1 gasdermin-D isoform X2 [Fukomys damarensis]XP_010637563.1 gasdermin-D isoform X2 [Fukomys damarensis]XP_010637564.1 gasdermin-D isoform X2 [Fukomys damarensis]XP_010637565.1 gasdermin-D isoform X2 [Fukomys damarensis]KFO26827.1 Gasdermin-D [Fukomys damarensis]